MDIEKKALALVNEVLRERGCTNEPTAITREYCTDEALCRAIEQHEAFRRDVSDAVVAFRNEWLQATPSRQWFQAKFTRFIIPQPDPLAEAWIEATGNTVGMEPLNAALAARGLKIVEDK